MRVKDICFIAALFMWPGGNSCVAAENNPVLPAPDVPLASREKHGSFYQSMNPDLSVIIDGFLHYDDSEKGLAAILHEIEGFGHSHGSGHTHEHNQPLQGFNLRHLEIFMSAQVDPYFKGWAIAAVDPEGAELEEAAMQTTALPWGFQIKAGKFFSDLGRINSTHAHAWDFTENALVNQLMFGEHGINDLGAQISWLAPADDYLLIGVEAYQGGNEASFPHIGEEPLPARDGPRLGVGWIKYSPATTGAHSLLAGSSFGMGERQEEHDGDVDGTPDHWLDGETWFAGVDLVYKYDSPSAYGGNDLTIQGEYYMRHMDLEIVSHDLNPAMVGRCKIDDQDGYYIQATYGFAPRWRMGMRWDHVGIVNSTEMPDGSIEEPGDSRAVSAMLEFLPSEFSRVRLGTVRSEFTTHNGKEEFWSAVVQLTISIGTHGAHKY